MISSWKFLNITRGIFQSFSELRYKELCIKYTTGIKYDRKCRRKRDCAWHLRVKVVRSLISHATVDQSFWSIFAIASSIGWSILSLDYHFGKILSQKYTWGFPTINIFTREEGEYWIIVGAYDRNVTGRNFQKWGICGWLFKVPKSMQPLLPRFFVT